MIEILAIKVAIFSIFFGMACYFVGNSLPDEWLAAQVSRRLQRLLLGFSTIIIILRLPYREDLPIEIFKIVLVALLSYGIGKFIWSIWRSFSIRSIRECVAAGECLALLLIALCAMGIGLFPLISSGALFFENVGPDLDGHMMSAALVLEGQTHADFIATLKAVGGTSHWWQLVEAWTYPDFRAAIGVEFLLRTMRYGHAVLAALIASVAGEKIWFGMLSLLLFSQYTIGIVLYTYLRQRGRALSEAFVLTLIVVASQTYIIMLYEGIIGQLVGTALILYLVLNLNSIVNDNKNLGQKFSVAILVSGLMSTFGEGVQILLILLCCFLLIVYWEKWLQAGRQKGLGKLLVPGFGQAVVSVAVITGFLFILSPAVFIDFWVWSYFRLIQGFAGGIGNVSWDAITVLSSFPHASLTATGKRWELIYSASHIKVIVSLLSLLLVALIFFISQQRRGAKEVVVGACTLLIFAYIGHPYALWKSMVILQPLILFGLYEMLPNKIMRLRKVYLLSAYLPIVMAGYVTLLSQYHHFAKRVYAEDYEIAGHDLSKSPVILITPTMSPMYLKLGATGPIYWANSGWGPNFSYNGARDLPLALYYTCHAEGDKRCREIESKNKYDLKPGKLLKLDMRTQSILKGDGSVDNKLLGQLILQSFGVEMK